MKGHVGNTMEELLQNSELLSLGKPHDHGW